jgi:hypothetical protein
MIVRDRDMSRRQELSPPDADECEPLGVVPTMPRYAKGNESMVNGVNRQNGVGKGKWACAFGFVGLSAALGCTELDLGSDDYCSLSLGTEPCINDGTGGTVNPLNPPTAWGCLGDAPDYTMPDIPGMAYVVPIQDFANPLITPPMLKIDVCIASDLNCTTPVTSALPPITRPDPAQPVYRIQLPTEPVPFEGYLRLTADGYIQTEYYFSGPMVGNPLNPDMPQVVIGQPITIPRVSSINEFFTRITPGAVRDENAGILALRVLNCDAQRSPNITLELNTDGVPFALANNQPVGPDSDGSVPRTDTRGVAGFVNVPAGGTAIVEAVLPDGRRFGRNGLAVRPNQLTAGEIRTDYAYGR